MVRLLLTIYTPPTPPTLPTLLLANFPAESYKKTGTRDTHVHDDTDKVLVQPLFATSRVTVFYPVFSCLFVPHNVSEALQWALLQHCSIPESHRPSRRLIPREIVVGFLVTTT